MFFPDRNRHLPRPQDLQNVDIYPEHRALNLLLLFLCNIHDYSTCLAPFHDGFILHLIEILPSTVRGTSSRRLVIINFFPKKIIYYCDGWLHKISHERTVWYIYYIMGLINVKWMQIILKDIECVFPLEWKILVKDFPYITGESTLRRFLHNPRTFIKLRAWFNRSLTPLEYAKGFSQLVKKNGSLHNMYEVFQGKKESHEMQTLYMHPYFFCGFYSPKYNKFNMVYLLAMEAVLDARHKWIMLDQNTFYCQVEMCHFYVWRQRWHHNIWLGIFMDSQLNAALTHPSAPSCNRYFVNHSDSLPEIFSDVDNSFARHFLPEFFYYKKFPSYSVLKLQSIARCQIFLNFFFNRIAHIIGLNLEDPYENENAQFFNNRKWKERSLFWIDDLNNYPPDKYQCHTLSRNFSVKMMRTQAHQIVNQCYQIAQQVPPMYTFTMMKAGDHFKKNKDLQHLVKFGMDFF